MQRKARLKSLLAEISTDLDLSSVQSLDGGNTALKGWLNMTIVKLTQAFTPQMPRDVTDYSLWLSKSISSLKIDLVDLKKQNRLAKAQIECNLKATVESLLKILGPKVFQSQSFIFIA